MVIQTRRHGVQPPPDASGVSAVSVVGSPLNETNRVLVAAWRERGIDARLMTAAEALASLRPGDVAFGRLDIVPTLDGVEDGLLALLLMERRGVRVLNTAISLLAAHDKLLTTRRLLAAGIRHPGTTHVSPNHRPPPLDPPLVLKPRFGSWGQDVLRCRDRQELDQALRTIRGRPWFKRHGALAQELLPSRGRDLRLLVGGGEVVGAAERTAAPGEWRTNVTLGGSKRHIDPDTAARDIAIAAAKATGADAVGVDLLPTPSGYIVLELNAAVDFDTAYSWPGSNVYADLARALGFRVR